MIYYSLLLTKIVKDNELKLKLQILINLKTSCTQNLCWNQLYRNKKIFVKNFYEVIHIEKKIFVKNFYEVIHIEKKSL